MMSECDALKRILDYAERLYSDDIATSDNQAAAVILDKITFNIQKEITRLDAMDMRAKNAQSYYDNLKSMGFVKPQQYSLKPISSL